MAPHPGAYGESCDAGSDRIGKPMTEASSLIPDLTESDPAAAVGVPGTAGDVHLKLNAVVARVIRFGVKVEGCKGRASVVSHLNWFGDTIGGCHLRAGKFTLCEIRNNKPPF